MGRCILCTGIRLLLIHPFISSFFFLSNFQSLKFFLTFLSGTVRSRRLKLGTYVDSGLLYRVYQNQVAASYLSLYFFIFLELQFSNIKVFVTLFSRAVRPGRETRYTRGQWADISCIPESGFCCLFVRLFLNFLSLQFYKH